MTKDRHKRYVGSLILKHALAFPDAFCVTQDALTIADFEEKPQVALFAAMCALRAFKMEPTEANLIVSLGQHAADWIDYVRGTCDLEPIEVLLFSYIKELKGDG